MKKEKDWTSIWNKKVSVLEGKTIKEVRYMTQEEQDLYHWDSKAVVIFFTDGSYIFPSSGDEGNSPGSLFTSIDSLSTIPSI